MCEQSSGDLFGGKVSDADEEKELKDEGETEVIDTHQVSVMFKSLSTWLVVVVISCQHV